MSTDSSTDGDPGRRPLAPLIVGVFLMGLGVLAAYGLIPTIVRNLGTHFWTETECLIEVAELTTDEHGGADLSVRYRYSVDGAEKTGYTHHLPTAAVWSKAELTKEQQRLVAGTTVACYYDSSNPDRVILFRSSLGNVFLILIPLVLFGLGVLFFVLARTGGAVSREVTIGKGTSQIGRYLFFGLFMAVGLGATYLFFGHRFLAERAARSWEAAQCTIASIELRSHSSKNSATTYSIDVTYTFERDGRRYVGERYSVADDPSSDYSSRREYVDTHQPGTKVECFVNPERPTESVIVRELSNRNWAGLFPMVFFLAGLFGLLATSPDKKRGDARFDAGKHILKEARAPVKAFVVALLATLVWNGIVGVGGFAFWDSWQKGHPQWFVLLILSPFLLIGLALIVSIPFAFLQMFNPGVRITMQPKEPIAGDSLTLGWQFFGRTSRISKLDIDLDLVSIAMGANNKRVDIAPENRSMFGDKVHSLQIVSTESQSTIARGERTVRLPPPEKVPHPHEKEKLYWRLSLRAHIPNFPDYVEVLDVPIRRSKDDRLDEELEDMADESE